MVMEKQKGPSGNDFFSLLRTLESRFNQHIERHPETKWPEVEDMLHNDPDLLKVLGKMEDTGGEPDIVELPSLNEKILFVDCSRESPVGRRSLCYDRNALESRKSHKPKNSAEDLAAEIGIEILTEELYRELQSKGPFDLKTSSWIKTPERIRKLGGALFCDFRFGEIFTYHNGAESYYSSRGFRGLIIVERKR